jgi:hypothetical protein
MERYIFMGAAIAMMVLGAGMIVMPGSVISVSRDPEDTRTPTAREVWRTRLAGVFVAAGSAYSLYALVTKIPGADFLTPCGTTPVQVESQAGTWSSRGRW